MLLYPDGMIMRTDKAYRKWARKFVSVMKSFDELDLAKLSEDELYREFKNMEQAYLKHYRLIRYGMVTHSIGTNLIIKRWLSSWLDDKQGVLYAKLISGLPDNKTIQTNIAISQLAQAARDDSKILQILQDKKPHEFLGELKKNSDLKSFSYKFYDFLDNYGHRSHTREIYFPRWADDPSLVITILQTLTSSPGMDFANVVVITILQTLASSPGMDFANVEKEKIKERETAEKEILGNISTLKNGFFKKLLFKTVLNYAQIYLVFRENQRFYLDHQLYRLRPLNSRKTYSF
jgi:pyruvate,water dikinase